MINKYKSNIDFTKKINRRETDVYIEINDQDRFDRISYRAYGDPQYWWLILQANGYQIEFDVEAGELIRIPYPLSAALSDIEV